MYKNNYVNSFVIDNVLMYPKSDISILVLLCII